MVMDGVTKTLLFLGGGGLAAYGVYCLVQKKSALAQTSVRQPPPDAKAYASDPAVVSVQLALRALGFDPGPVDGVMGANTASALRKFQNSRGLPATGQMDAQTIDALKSLGLATQGGGI